MRQRALTGEAAAAGDLGNRQTGFTQQLRRLTHPQRQYVLMRRHAGGLPIKCMKMATADTHLRGQRRDAERSIQVGQHIGLKALQLFGAKRAAGTRDIAIQAETPLQGRKHHATQMPFETIVSRLRRGQRVLGKVQQPL